MTSPKPTTIVHPSGLAPRAMGVDPAGDICIDCDGAGVYPSGATCKCCGGSGRVLPGDGIPAASVSPDKIAELREESDSQDWVQVASPALPALLDAYERADRDALKRDAFDGSLSSEAIAEARKILCEAGVPVAAFFDDHVHNACILLKEAEAGRDKAEERVRELEGEREQIHALLDEHQLAMPGGSIDWPLVGRVHVACAAATDEDDRRRADTATADVKRLREALERAAEDIVTVATALRTVGNLPYIAAALEDSAVTARAALTETGEKT